MPKAKIQENKCKVFHCDRRRGQYCCSYCDYKKIGCHNSCQNSPRKCGLFKEEENE